MKKTFFTLVVLFSLSVSLLAQASFPRFGAIESDGVTTLNRYNLGWTKSIQLVSLASRGLTFNPRLTYNSFIWLKNQASTGAYSWSPVVDGDGNPTWGWRRDGSPVLESDLTYKVFRWRCVANDGSNQWGYEYYDFKTSTLRFDLDVSLAERPEEYPECGDASTQQMSAYGRDSGGAPTGYYLVLQGNGGPMPWPFPTWAPPYAIATNNTRPKLFAPGGTQVDMSGSMQDFNGNRANWGVNGQTVTWSDSIGRQSLVITNDTTNHITTYRYPDTNGVQQTWTFHYSQMNVGTAFGCSNTSEYSQNGLYLPTSLDLPGTNGSYTISYEQTPGNSGATTGRISKITLPTGGWISFSYSGVNCDDGSPTQMVKTISDGTQSNPPSWTYTRTNSGGWTTQVDGPSHSELIAFNADGVPTDSKVYVAGAAGPVLQEVQTDYDNGAPYHVTTTNGGQSQLVVYGFDGFGNVLSKKEFDWNSTSTVLRATSNTYVQDSNYVWGGLPGLLSTSTLYQGGFDGTIASKTQYFYDQKNPDGTADSDGGNIAMACVTGASAHNDTDYACSSTTPRGNLTRVVQYTDAANSAGAIKTYYGYDSLGNLVKVKDGKGNSSNIGYADNWEGTSSCSLATSAYAYPTSVSNALGHTQTLWYNRCTGQAVRSRDPNNQSTTIAYNDALLRPTSVTYPDNASGTPSIQYSYTTTTQEVDTLQSVSPTITRTDVTTLDGLGRTIRTSHSDPAGNDLVDTTYDGDGRVHTVSNPYRTGSPDNTTYSYNALGQTTNIQLPDGNNISYTVSGNTNVVGGTASSPRTLVYDALGNISQVQEPNPAGGSALLTDYLFNPLGRLTSVTQHGTGNELSRVRNFSYDSLGRLITEQTPEAGTICYGTWSGGGVGSGACQNGYDANGNLLYKTDARGVISAYTYDALNRPFDISYSDGTPGRHWRYDTTPAWGGSYSGNNVGRLQQASTDQVNGANTVKVFDYDAMGRIKFVAEGLPSETPIGSFHVTSLGYDLAGNVTSITYPDTRHVTQSYDSAGRLAKVTYADWNGTAVNYDYLSSAAYAPSGTMSSMTLGNGVNQQFGYNNRLQVSSITAGPASASSPLFLSKQYCYPTCNGSAPNNGNIGKIQDQLNSSKTQTFDYDNLNRIKYFGGSGASQTYSYDSFGNLSQSGTMSSVLSFDSNNRISSGGYRYDAAGNVISFNNGVTSTSYGFDGENRIANVNGGATANYRYDADGNRVRKDASGEWQEYDFLNGQVLAEKHSDGSWTDYIYANGKRIARTDSYDQRIHLHGNRCDPNNCGWQTAAWRFPVPVYTIKNGDKISWLQYQGGGAIGGLSLVFSNGVNTNWNTTDLSGQVMNNLTTHYAWVARTVDLSQFAGTNLGDAWIGVEGQTASGDWDEWFEAIAIYSTDGTVTPIYNRADGLSLAFFGSSGMTNLSGGVERSNSAADAMVYANNTTYYVSDHLGSASLELSGSGWPVASTTLYPFGQVIADNATENKYKFTGQERDSETGLDHFMFRSYNSTTGRWMSPDPYLGSYDLTNPQSMNRYAYALNNPNKWIDPLGLNIAQGCVVDIYNEDGEYLYSYDLCNQPSGDSGPPPGFMMWVCGTDCDADPTNYDNSQTAGVADAPSNTNPNSRWNCAKYAGGKDGNGASVFLDAAGIAAGFLPGGGLVTGTAKQAAFAFGAQVGLTAASTSVSIGYKSGPGIVAGILGGQVALTSKAAEALAVEVGKSIPIVGVAVSTGALLYDGYQTYKAYSGCLNGVRD